MKKIIISITSIFIIFALVGCENNFNSNIDNENDSSKEVEILDKDKEDKRVYITEDLYEPWISQIYLDPREYEGSIIRLEGIYTTNYSETDKKNYNMVYRIVTGGSITYEHTHEDDHDHADLPQNEMYGFEFDYDGNMPKENDWIEVEGILEVYEVNGEDNLKIKANSVTIKSERGKEVIS